MAKQESFTLNIGARTAASYDRTMNKISKNLLGFARNVNLAGKLATASFVGREVIEFGKDAVETYKTFDSSMKNTAAIMNATVSEYERLEDAARQAGRTTTKTASESADALGYMALAGWNVEDSVKGLTPILRLAESTGKDLQTTSDLVTDSMSALGISVDDLDKYMDKLVMTNNSANTSAEQLMYALVKSGGSARVLGLNLDDTITALGIFANNGLKSSEAGTALNSLLKRWGSNTQAQKALDALNIDLYDAQDNFIGLEELMKRLNKGMAGMGADEKNGLMSMLGGRFMSQLKYLMDSVETSGDETVSTWGKLTDRVTSAEGALDTMNQTALSSMQASQKLLESAWQDLQISAVDVYSEDAKEFMRDLASGLPQISDMLSEFEEEHHDEIIDFLDGTADLVLQIAEKGIQLGDFILDNGPAIAGILSGIFVGNMASEAIGAIGGIRTAVGEAGGLMALLSNPAGWVVGGIGLAAGAFVGIQAQIKKTNDELVRSSLAEHFGELSLSIGELQDVARGLIEDDNLLKIEAALEEYEKLNGISGTIGDAAAELKKLNWKAQLGIEMTEADNSNYKNYIDSYIENSKAYIDQAQYAASLNLSEYFDADSPTMNKINEFYNDNRKTLTKTAKKLNKAVNKAFSDGLLTPDEAEVISGYQEAMASIMDTLAESEYDATTNLIKAKYGSLGDLDAETFSKMQGELDKQLEEYTTAQEESYKKAYAAAKNAGASQEELDVITSGHLAKISQKQLEMLTLSTDTISEAFKLNDELASLRSNAGSLVSGLFSKEDIADITSGNATVDWNNIFRDAQKSIAGVVNSLSNGDRMAIEEKLEQLAPRAEYLKQLADKYREEGKMIPESITQGINEYEELMALTGDESGLWNVIASELANDSGYNALLEYLNKQGQGIPDELATAITNNQSAVQMSIDNLYQYTSRQLLLKYQNPINVPAKIKLLTGEVNVDGGNKNGTGTVKAYAMAAGGIYDHPILTTFAEEGPEAAIPLNNKPRSVALWQQAGEMMGMSGGSSINYNPQIIVQGNASKEDIVEAQEIGLSRFKALYKEMVRQEGRVAFAR